MIRGISRAFSYLARFVSVNKNTVVNRRAFLGGTAAGALLLAACKKAAPQKPCNCATTDDVRTIVKAQGGMAPPILPVVPGDTALIVCRADADTATQGDQDVAVALKGLNILKGKKITVKPSDLTINISGNGVKIIRSSISINANGHISFKVNVAENAEAAARNITVSFGGETYTLKDGFTVLEKEAPAPMKYRRGGMRRSGMRGGMQSGMRPAPALPPTDPSNPT